jgi:hypothetical protein
MSGAVVSKWIENILKVILAITAFMAVSIFNDMRDEIRSLRMEMADIRERLSYIEGQLKNK